MLETPRRGRQARNFATNAPKILELKSSSEQIFSRKLPLGTPELFSQKPSINSPRTILVLQRIICEKKDTRRHERKKEQRTGEKMTNTS